MWGLGRKIAASEEGREKGDGDDINIRIIPLEIYLHTSCEPDVEYVDDELEERNGG